MNQPATFTTVNKVGLGLASLLGLFDLVSVLSAAPEGEVGPPFAILVLDSLLGLVTLVGVAWTLARRNRDALRVVAAARIVSAITALPAFFVDIPAGLKLLAGMAVLVTVASVVMMLTPARRTTLVTD